LRGVSTVADLPYDCLLFDIGGTLVAAADPATPVADLRPVLLPDVDGDLRRLAGEFRLGAMTNTAVMREADVRVHLDAVGIDGLLEVVVTSVDVGAQKPDPRGLSVAMQRIGAAPQRTLYIGDLPTDRDAARRAGCDFAYVDGTLGETVAAALRRAGRPFFRAARAIAPPDAPALQAARDRHDRLAKPPGSLGVVEAVGVQLAGIAGSCPPPDPFPAAVAVFAADHGVAAAGVTMWPQALTGVVAGVVAGGRAGINAIAATVGADVHVIDVGTVAGVSGRGVRVERVRAGTADLTAGPAMDHDDVLAALDVGVAVADDLVDGGARCLVTGEVGIGNTTAAAAIVAALTGAPGADVAGRGAGADDATLARKAAAIDAAMARIDPPVDPLRVLAEVGGLEIAAIAGFVVGAASRRVPVIVDGAIACAALLAAVELAPAALPYAIAGHRSAEPAGGIVLDRLGLVPLLDLGMRLGEGTGACLALPTVRAAARVLTTMATLEELGAPPG
jgi:nicotinate-nucleotide--dimethylbenzimidazole phosphoribosyltransferase